LAKRATELFEKQPAGEKRQLLRFLVRECRWKTGELIVEYRSPFNAIVSNCQFEDIKKVVSIDSAHPRDEQEDKGAEDEEAQVARLVRHIPNPPIVSPGPQNPE
jgi:hypothetical protein